MTQQVKMLTAKPDDISSWTLLEEKTASQKLSSGFLSTPYHVKHTPTYTNFQQNHRKMYCKVHKNWMLITADGIIKWQKSVCDVARLVEYLLYIHKALDIDWFNPQCHKNLKWWCASDSIAIWEVEAGNQTFKVTIIFTADSRLAWDTWWLSN